MHRGFPRRYVQPGQDVQVWCSGRWGPRRVRVNQCWVTVRAEDLYTALLKDDADSVRPGAKGTATFNPGRDTRQDGKFTETPSGDADECFSFARRVRADVRGFTCPSRTAHSPVGPAGASPMSRERS